MTIHHFGLIIAIGLVVVGSYYHGYDGHPSKRAWICVSAGCIIGLATLIYLLR